jgi:hypothetical protein
MGWPRYTGIVVQKCKQVLGKVSITYAQIYSKLKWLNNLSNFIKICSVVPDGRTCTYNNTVAPVPRHHAIEQYRMTKR